MTSYDIFAQFYDATMGDRSDVIGLLKQVIKQHQPSCHEVLELGCGTGSILAGLSHTYDVTGIDKSIKMLQIAQQKLPKSRLEQADLSHFSLNTKFDAIICVFDTINHLPDFASWQSCFSCVFDHLHPGGLFIFDINTVGRMAALRAMPTYTQTLGDTSVDMAIISAGDAAVDWHITVQQPGPDGIIQVFEDEARERSYPQAQVAAGLTTAGFTVLDRFDSARLAPTDQSDRIYFVCRWA